jgi:hypothetical protein
VRKVRPQPATQRRTRGAIAASVAVHVALGLVLLAQRPSLVGIRPEAGQAVLSVILMPRAARPAAQTNSPLALSPRLAQARPPDRSPAAAPLAAPASQPSEAAQEPLAGAPSSAPDLRQALRHGLAGCVNAIGLTRTERQDCDDRLAQGARQAPLMGIGLEPRIQAYYAAVAEAKTGATGHPPLIGCRIPFGPGKPRKLPSHWLTLGPCFIAPPKGSLTPEADITPPDQDMNPR